MGKRTVISLLLLAMLLPGSMKAQVFNRAPLEESPYALLPLGSVRPSGWLREQLLRQASGLTGHLDEVYPAVMGPSNAWLGGDGDAWERGPYWIDGLLPLAFILGDQTLVDKALVWVEAILASRGRDGRIGPARDNPFVYGLQRGGSQDWWPRMVALKILQQYYEATGDARAIECLSAYFSYQLETLAATPLDHWTDWGRWRGADNLAVVYWLYNITGQEYLLRLGELLHSQTTDWTSLFRDGAIFHAPYSVHCVNLAQGFKAPVVWWQYSHSSSDLEAPLKALAAIRGTVGLPTGLWAGDEQLHSGEPTRGSELCTAVEMMFSAEEMLRITGDPAWADCLERVAFNALPAQVNDTFTAKQYYQQANQVSCTLGWGPFSTPHDGTDTVFGTLNGYPCCLSNMHQGWPKFTRNLWYATPDGGLAALVYAPCEVNAKVAGGTEITLTEDTAYPFRDEVRFTIGMPRCRDRKASFPLRFRVPGWCGAPRVFVNSQEIEAASENGIICLQREWRRNDEIRLVFPMETEVEEWYDRAWTIVRGPLVYALRMKENWTWKDLPGGWYGPGAWEVTSPSPWNYCIMRDSFEPSQCSVNLSGPVARSADAASGKLSETIAAYPWSVDTAPVSITVPARELPHWTEPSAVAFWTEDGYDAGKPVTIELIPYGCTTLRITEFPTRIVPWDVEYRSAVPTGLSRL